MSYKKNYEKTMKWKKFPQGFANPLLIKNLPHGSQSMYFAPYVKNTIIGHYFYVTALKASKVIKCNDTEEYLKKCRYIYEMACKDFEGYLNMLEEDLWDKLKNRQLH